MKHSSTKMHLHWPKGRLVDAGVVFVVITLSSALAMSLDASKPVVLSMAFAFGLVGPVLLDRVRKVRAKQPQSALSMGHWQLAQLSFERAISVHSMIVAHADAASFAYLNQIKRDLPRSTRKQVIDSRMYAEVVTHVG
jgi:hypothetical protein